MEQSKNYTAILALDVGTVRIGLAISQTSNYLINLLPTLSNDENFVDNLKRIILERNVSTLVIGMPRNMSGEKTKQSLFVENFVSSQLNKLGLKIIYQDESLTSVKAEEILNARGKNYSKAEIDSVSASLILEDYLAYLNPKR